MSINFNISSLILPKNYNSTSVKNEEKTGRDYKQLK